MKRFSPKVLVAAVLCIVTVIALAVPVSAGNEAAVDSSVLPYSRVLPYVDNPFGTTPKPGDQAASLSSEISGEAVARSLELYTNFIAADPELFFMTEDGLKDLTFDEPLTDAELDYVEQRTLEITAGADTTEEKIFAAMEYLAQNICYDDDHIEKHTPTNENAYDILINEYTVCRGYAVTFATMMQLLDIPCVYVNAPNHAWNMVYCGQWMLVDVTWISMSTYEDGEKHKSDRLWLDWFDFTIEEANANYNHTIEGLPLEVYDKTLWEYPQSTTSGDFVVPANVETVSCRLYDIDRIENLYIPRSVKEIGRYVFGYSQIGTVFYEGTKEEFQAIHIDSGNNPLLNAAVVYEAYDSVPVITAQPEECAIRSDMAAELSVEAVSGGGALSYQWYMNTARSNKNGTPIPGATSPTYYVYAAPEGISYYYVEVRNGDGAAVSVPVPVGVYEEFPDMWVRLKGSDIYYVVFAGKQELLLDGYGSVLEDHLNLYYSSDFNKVTIGKGVTGLPENLSSSSLFNYNQVEFFAVDPQNPAYSNDIRGVLFNKDQTTLLQAPGALSGNYSVPDAVTRIGDAAFSRCYRLTAVTIPDSVVSLGENLFTYCSYLASVRFTGDPPDLGDNTFYYCYSLSSLMFEGDAPRFGSNVFSGVEAEVYYPGDNGTWTDEILQDYGGTVTWIPFYGGALASGVCGSEGDGSNLTWTLSVDGTLTVSGQGKMEEGFFHAPWYEYADMISAAVLEPGVTSVGHSAFYDCATLESVTLPDSVTSIGSYAFYFCRSLGSVAVPAAVTSIGDNAFYGCSALTGFHVAEANSVYSSDSFGVLFDKDKTVLIQAPAGIKDAYTVPDGVVSIQSEAFYECYFLTSVSIPDSVTSIGHFAFFWCDSLISVNIPDKVTVIENGTFFGCTALASVTIPASVTTIEQQAFYNCDRLSTIRFQGDAPTFGSDVFESVRATVYYPSGKETWTEEVRQDYGGSLTWIPSGEVLLERGVCTETESRITALYDPEAIGTIACYFALYDADGRFLRVEVMSGTTWESGSMTFSIRYTAEEGVGRVAVFVADPDTFCPLARSWSQVPA